LAIENTETHEKLLTLMDHKKRKQLVEEVKVLISKNFPNYSHLQREKKEAIQDKYLEYVCLRDKHTLAEFFDTAGIFLNPLFKSMY
jgi:hypothetical protein